MFIYWISLDMYHSDILWLCYLCSTKVLSFRNLQLFIWKKIGMNFAEISFTPIFFRNLHIFFLYQWNSFLWKLCFGFVLQKWSKPDMNSLNNACWLLAQQLWYRANLTSSNWNSFLTLPTFYKWLLNLKKSSN